MKKVIVIGGGAAGMLAAIAAGRKGHEVHILEKNEKLGKKLFITGKGRCNVTNDCDVETLLKNVVVNPKFLYSAFYGFTSQDMMTLLEDLGLPLKVERGGRVFPVSDKSSDVIAALKRELDRLCVKIHYRAVVQEIITAAAAGAELGEHSCVQGVLVHMEKKDCFLAADRVIVATGGLSYKATGSTGDGLDFARALGHQVTQTMPSLVPLNIREPWCRELMGLSLKNVRAAFMGGKKCVYEDFGEMLFTHFGVSGPLILSGSAHVVQLLYKNKAVSLVLDLKPALSMEQLDARILRDFEENKNKQFRNVLSGLLPAKLIPVMVELSGIDPYKQVNEISREERQALCRLLKNFSMTVESARDYGEAIITRGGVCVKEINPQTMESKKVQGLYFAGEVLDLDALTGGFNLQIAWATAWAAGMHLEEASF